MKWLITLCLSQRFVVLGLSAVLVVMGVLTTSGASLDAFPEFAPPRVEIQTEALGLSSEEVESLVTMPLESTLAGMPAMTEIRSKSVLGLSSVVLIFKSGTDLLTARALVTERIARAQLSPVASRPVVLSPLSSTSRVLKVALWSKTRSRMEMTDLVRWIVRPKLMSVPGVANVAIWGERTRQLQVQVDPVLLQAQGVTLDQVVAITGEAVSQQPGGFVDGPNQRLAVLHSAIASTVLELAQVPIASATRALILDDIARVVEDHPLPIGEAVVTGGQGLLLIVEKQPGANTLDVTRGISETLAALAPSLPDIEMDDTIFRPAGYIERALKNLSSAMIIGVILVIIILLIFLWDWRTAIISVLAIPLSLLAAASILTLLGKSLDTMVIAGLIIALGEVVDDAIIDVENIHRRLREAPNRSAADTFRIVLDASLEVRSAVVYATIIVTLVFVPVFFLPGVAGEFFRPLALGYGLAVFASLVVALTLTPALALLLLPGHISEHREPPVAVYLRVAYRFVLRGFIRWPWLIVTASLAAVIASVSVLSTLEEEFLPHFAENDFLMHWIGKPGTSLAAMERTSELARAELLTIPGVRNFGAHIGRAEVADEVVGPNFAELWISVDPEVDLDATLQQVSEVVEGYPGIYRDVQTFLQERMREVVSSGGSGAITVRLYGPDLDALRTHGAALATTLSGVAGVEHASASAQEMVPQIEITPRLGVCAALGVNVGSLRQQLTTLVQGRRVGTIVRNQQPLDVVVWSTPETRDDISALRKIPILDGAGGTVLLGDVADVRVSPMANAITHHAGSRKLDVTVRLAPGADLGVTARAVEAKVSAYRLPAGHHADVLGEHQARAQARQTLLWVGLLAMFGVFLVLLADLRSLRLAVLVMASLPLALVGAVIVTSLTGGIVSLGTLVGLVTVLGIAARNGILLISHYRHLEVEEGVPFGPELILRGAAERLSPILMTALSTGLALVPLVIGENTAGHEIEHPMAVVILGGLISSTFLNLFAMPAVVLVSRRATPTPPDEEPLQGGVEPLQGGVEPLQGGVESLQGDEEPLQGDKETLQGGVEPLQGGVEPLQGDKETLRGGVESLQGAEESLQGD